MDREQSLGSERLAWVNFRMRPDIPACEAARQRLTACRLLAGLYGDGVPGMILGDDVGMGKTYVTFGVVAALLHWQPKARVVILTHSRGMAESWRDRWRDFLNGVSHGNDLPQALPLEDPADIGKSTLAIGSYEGAKRHDRHLQRSVLDLALAGLYLRRPTKRRLTRDVLGIGTHPEELPDGRRPSQVDLQAIRRHLDRENGAWSSRHGAREAIRRAMHQLVRTRRRIDLLVVDEAHKMAADGRRIFLEETLSARARKALYVTATPFALRVDDLVDRIRDLFTVTGQSTKALSDLTRDLQAYTRVVDHGDDLEPGLRRRIQSGLGRYLVRSIWPATFPGTNRPRRQVTHLHPQVATEDLRQGLAAIALEDAFGEIQEEHCQTHRATHRETLCSSYAAIRAAADRPAGRIFKRLTKLLPTGTDSPKFERAVDHLASCAELRQKVVVFCKRTETIQALAQAVTRTDRIKDLVHEERRAWKRALPHLGDLSAEERALVRLGCAHGLPVRTRREQSRVIRWASRHCWWTPGTGTKEQELLLGTWGYRRRTEWVAKLTGNVHERRSDAVTGRSRQEIQFTFNLPGPPYILFCTSVAREGIDLHRQCRRIMHYDLEWNPAFMEQCNGRIDRIGSLSWRKGQPLEIYYIWQAGTYEERIARAVELRQHMMRSLIGAGGWLGTDIGTQASFSKVREYVFNFGVSNW